MAIASGGSSADVTAAVSESRGTGGRKSTIRPQQAEQIQIAGKELEATKVVMQVDE